jgi:hypothetical protein
LDFLIGILDEKPAYTHGCKVILDSTLELFVHKDNLLAKERCISPEMLAGQPFVLVPKGSQHYELLISAFKDVPLDVALYSTQIPTIRYEASLFPVSAPPIWRPFWQTPQLLQNLLRRFHGYGLEAVGK